MRLTRITKQKKGNRYNLYSDQTFVAGVSEGTLVRSGLAQGDDVDEQTLKRLQSDDEQSQALVSAYGYLARRPHSGSELRKKLEAKGYSQPGIGSALKRLEELGYVNDREFAKAWIRERGGDRGFHLLNAELRKKGIDPDIISEALAERTEDKEADLSQVRDLAAKRYARLRSQPWETVYARLGGYLSRRGYPSDLVRQLLSEFKEIHPAS